MEFPSSHVMAYVLKKGKQEKYNISKVKAQKLLYCCYGTVMAKFDERLTDEHPRAWLYGPVFLRTVKDIDKQRLTVEMAEDFQEKCPPDHLNLINNTIKTFAKYTSTQLSNWSHMKGSPWAKADPLAALDDREIRNFFTPYLEIVEKGDRNCQPIPR